LSSGHLVRLLPGFPLQDAPLNLVYYHRELIPPRVRALVEFLIFRLTPTSAARVATTL